MDLHKYTDNICGQILRSNPRGDGRVCNGSGAPPIWGPSMSQYLDYPRLMPTPFDAEWPNLVW